MSRILTDLCIASRAQASEPRVASKLLVGQEDVNIHAHKMYSTLNSSAMGVDSQGQFSYDTMSHATLSLSFNCNEPSNSSVSSYSSMFNVSSALYAMALTPNNEQDLYGIGHWAEQQFPQCDLDFYDTISELFTPSLLVEEALSSFDAQFFDSYEATTGLCFPA